MSSGLVVGPEQAFLCSCEKSHHHVRLIKRVNARHNLHGLVITERENVRLLDGHVVDLEHDVVGNIAGLERVVVDAAYGNQDVVYPLAPALQPRSESFDILKGNGLNLFEKY